MNNPLQIYRSNHGMYVKKGKDCFLLISKAISYEEKMCNEINVKAKVKTSNIYFDIDRKSYVFMKKQWKKHWKIH